MQKAIGKFIQHQMRKAETFVRNKIEVNLSADEVYEQLVGEPHVLEAFRNAAQYLLPSGLNTSTHIHFGFGSNSYNKVRVMLRLPTTNKYPVKFLPQYAMQVTRESKLGQVIAKQLAFTAQWAELNYVFEQFHLQNLSVLEMAFLMKWIRELIAESDCKDEPMQFVNRWSGEWSKKAQRDVEREINQILSGVTPNHFPVVTKRVNEICKSGKSLFSQYRLLSSISETNEPPLISLFEPDNAVDDDLRDEMQGITQAWKEDCNDRYDEAHQQMVVRHNAKWGHA